MPTSMGGADGAIKLQANKVSRGETVQKSKCC